MVAALLSALASTFLFGAAGVVAQADPTGGGGSSDLITDTAPPFIASSALVALAIALGFLVRGMLSGKIVVRPTTEREDRLVDVLENTTKVVEKNTAAMTRLAELSETIVERDREYVQALRDGQRRP